MKMLNILIADDHFLVRKGLRQLLEENLPVTGLDEAEDGLEALELARGRHYDLVILDFSMPGRDGLDLIRDLKDNQIGMNAVAQIYSLMSGSCLIKLSALCLQ